MNKNWVFAFSFFFFLAGVVFFYKGKNTHQHEVKNEPVTETSTYSPRQPSSDNNNEVGLLNAALYGIQTKADVEPAFKRIQEIYKRHPQSAAAHLYASLADSASHFKGIGWRIRFIIEPVDALYINFITSLRAIKRNNDRRAPHLDALFDYFLDPNPNEDILGQKGQFASLHQLQDWMAGQVAPRIDANIQKSNALIAKADEDTPLFFFDSGLVFGAEEAERMGSQTIRYRKFLPGHMKGLLANMEEKMGFGYYLASYNMEALGRFINTLTTKSFLAKKSEFKRSWASNVFDIHLQSPREISKELDEKDFRNFLILRPEGKTYLPEAIKHLRKANALRIEAYKSMQRLADLPNQDDYFISGDAITSRTTLNLAVLQKRKRLLEGEKAVAFNDRVTNDEFEVNIAAMFDPTNPGIQDLKKLYPKKFVNVPEKDGRDPKTFKWNFIYGMATEWPDHTFAGILPGTGNSQEYKNKLISISRDAATPGLTYWLRLFY